MNTPEIHRWFVGEQEWMCVASDHSPFCRLCHPIDDTLAALLEQVTKGNLEVRQRPDGELEFVATPGAKDRINREFN